MVTTATIKLDNLLLSTENFRYETLNDQKEAITRMLEEQGEKLVNLAQHIMKHGLNPNDKIQVSPSSHEKSKYNVLEGNRRVVTLKFLKNPNLIDDPSYLPIKEKFKALEAANADKLIDELECIVYDNPEEAYEWIKLKHTGQRGGVGTVDWNAQQVQRFEEKVEGKSSIALQAMNFLKKSNCIPSDIKSNLSILPITNLDRLLSDPDVRDFFGIEVNNGILQSGINEEEVGKGLAQLAKHLLHPAFNVKRIYTKDDRKDYLKQFPVKKQPDLSKKSDKLWQLTDVSPAKKITKPKTSKERKYLIPKSCIMKISNPKVNSIYDELQRLNVNNFKNAVAVTFRVFIELSLDCYIEANGLDKNPASGKGFKSLKEKVSDVTNHLITMKAADKNICKGIRTAVSDKNDLLGIDTWHAYVHNPYYSPTPQNLLITWDNVQKFVEILWSHIK